MATMYRSKENGSADFHDTAMQNIGIEYLDELKTAMILSEKIETTF